MDLLSFLIKSLRNIYENRSVISNAAIPSINNVFGAPIYCEILPINKPPRGCKPKNAIAK